MPKLIDDSDRGKRDRNAGVDGVGVGAAVVVAADGLVTVTGGGVETLDECGLNAGWC